MNGNVPARKRVIEVVSALGLISAVIVTSAAVGYPVYVRWVLNPQMAAALDNGSATEVYKLLRLGASTKSRGRYPFTPLLVAAETGHLPLMREMLARGTDIDERAAGMTPLIAASVTGQIGSVNALINAGAQVNARDEAGATSLMYAASNGYPAIITVLLRSGADPNAVDNAGESALTYGVNHFDGRVSCAVVQLLLTGGADPASGRTGDRTPVKLAAKRQNAELVRILQEATQLKARTRQSH